MQAPMRHRNRCSAYVERLVSEHGGRLTDIDNYILYGYKAQFAVGCGCIKYHLGFQGIKDRINEGRIRPVITHPTKAWH